MVKIRNVAIRESIREYPLMALVQNINPLETESTGFHLPRNIRVQHVIFGTMTEIAQNHAKVPARRQTISSKGQCVRQYRQKIRVASHVAKVLRVLAILRIQSVRNSLLLGLVVLLVQNIPIWRTGHNEFHRALSDRWNDRASVAHYNFLVQAYVGLLSQLGLQPKACQIGILFTKLDSDSPSALKSRGLQGRADANERVEYRLARFGEETD